MVFKIDGREGFLQAALALNRAEGELRESMMARADSLIDQTWEQSLLSASGTAVERKLLATGANADLLPTGFMLTAGQGPTLSGGMDAEHWPAVEFGMVPKQITTPNRVRTRLTSGRQRPIRTAVLIWVGRNFKPRNLRGYVIFPTVRTRGPEYVAAMIHGVIDTFRVHPLEIQKD